MTGRLHLVIPADSTGIETDCALCGEPLQVEMGTPILYQGDLPHGYACPTCTAGSPVDAVPKILARVRQADLFIAQAKKALPAMQNAGTIKATIRRIDYWNKLAEQLGKLKAWTIERRSRSEPSSGDGG